MRVITAEGRSPSTIPFITYWRHSRVPTMRRQNSFGSLTSTRTSKSVSGRLSSGRGSTTPRCSARVFMGNPRDFRRSGRRFLYLRQRCCGKLWERQHDEGVPLGSQGELAELTKFNLVEFPIRKIRGGAV